MRLLVDTHALLWWFFDAAELSPDAREAIADADNEAWVSSASGWEIATKHRLGRLPEAGDIARRLPSYLGRGRFEVLPISMEHALAAGGLPGPHRDPFDRMLIAQARLEDLTIVTRDPVFRDYGAAILW
ncbi:MAG TPA: type II toxin-antitoxin system VapC family toxin [Kiloniellales bacterium]|nr:type II toxin-antitoxin system VapC family toxin [Kiloniellales bacterium]